MNILARLLLVSFSLVVLFLILMENFPLPSLETISERWPMKTDLHVPSKASFHNITLSNNIRLTVMEGGQENEKVVVLLHGFPETALLTWGDMIDGLVDAGYHVVAPDLRGYNTSSKPADVMQYTLDHMVQDISLLLDEHVLLGKSGRKILLVGHDWGASVSWVFAQKYPERVRKLVACSAPHPSVLFSLKRPKQLLASSYFAYLSLKGVAERHFSKNNYSLMLHALQFVDLADKGIISKPILLRYIDTWSKPGALTAMLNYYRALPYYLWNTRNEEIIIKVPTLLIHGTRDQAATVEVMQAAFELVDSSVAGKSLFKQVNATHWVGQEIPQTLLSEILQFAL